MNEVTTSQDVKSLTGFGESGRLLLSFTDVKSLSGFGERGRLLLPFTDVKSLTGFEESDGSLYRY